MCATAGTVLCYLDRAKEGKCYLDTRKKQTERVFDLDPKNGKKKDSKAMIKIDLSQFCN